MADRHRQRARLAQVGAQGPPTRRSARLATAAARARGSLLCTTWTKPQPNLRATKPNSVQFLMSKRVQFRMSVDTAQIPSRQALVTPHLGDPLAGAVTRPARSTSFASRFLFDASSFLRSAFLRSAGPSRLVQVGSPCPPDRPPAPPGRAQRASAVDRPRTSRKLRLNTW
jgi:hypothetical protein